MPTEVEVIATARQILGNKQSVIVGEQYVPDDAVLPGLRPYVRRLNKKFGTATGRKEQWFDTVANQQDYVIADVVGSDVSTIEQVVRSDESLPSDSFGPVEIDARDGTPLSVGGIIPFGGQGDAMRAILEQQRWLRADDFAWSIAYPAAGKSLRLMPCPTQSGIKVFVSYVTTAGDISTLPDEATDALNFAACVAMLDAMLNRLNSERGKQEVTAAADAKTMQLRTLEKQRARYEGLYEDELTDLGA